MEFNVCNALRDHKKIQLIIDSVIVGVIITLQKIHSVNRVYKNHKHLVVDARANNNILFGFLIILAYNIANHHTSW